MVSHFIIDYGIACLDLAAHPFEDMLQDINVNVSSASIIFHKSQEIFEIRGGCKLKPLVL